MTRIRPDQIESWTTENPVLESGELGYELETGFAKLGDGATAWNDLEYWSPKPDSSSVAPDFVRWHRVAAPDETSGSLDYVANAVTTSGTAVFVDDSTDWITDVAGWGYAVAAVAEDGVYAVTASCVSTAVEGQFQPSFSTAAGGSFNNYPHVSSGCAEGGGGSFYSNFSFTAYLPAGTHMELYNLPASTTKIDLMIQRVAA